MLKTLKMLTFLAVILSFYLRLIRRWIKHWGLPNANVVRDLPGSDLIPEPRYCSTRAIVIDAPAADIWPWLVQMGQGRGGLYSYDWLENAFGLDFHSADEVVPELQDLKPGDHICLAPEGEMPLAVTILEPNYALVLRTGQAGSPQQPGDYVRGEIAASWAFVLQPIDEKSTRLLVDWRADWRPGLLADLLNVFMLEPVHFIMERGMMRGIKNRAERNASTAT